MCIDVCVQIHRHTYIYIYVYICIYICTYVYAYVHVCMYVYIYIYAFNPTGLVQALLRIVGVASVQRPPIANQVVPSLKTNSPQPQMRHTPCIREPIYWAHLCVWGVGGVYHQCMDSSCGNSEALSDTPQPPKDLRSYDQLCIDVYMRVHVCTCLKAVCRHFYLDSRRKRMATLPVSVFIYVYIHTWMHIQMAMTRNKGAFFTPGTPFASELHGTGLSRILASTCRC